MIMDVGTGEHRGHVTPTFHRFLHKVPFFKLYKCPFYLPTCESAPYMHVPHYFLNGSYILGRDILAEGSVRKYEGGLGGRGSELHYKIM